jgi:hypothetical protein
MNRPLPKFILIDNSISDTAGHHYQYAEYCLRAAKELGYESILATNKKNKDTENLPWKVYPVYTGTFWLHEEYNNFLLSIYNRFEKSKRKVVLSGILRVMGPRLATKLLDKNKIAEFAKNSQDLFSQISLSKGDIIFIPTSGLVEMYGITECATNNQSLQNATYHFLFRRNLYNGTPENYSFMYIKLRLLKLAFDNFLKKTKINAIFYTDSDQLTDQYDRIESVKFHTLPLPHTIPKSAQKKKKNKLQITYLGDARTEKGYQYLPHLVQDLWADYVKQDKVSFVIQSNYNITDGEPSAVVAREQLQHFPNDKVNLVMKSPSVEEYGKILDESDVILLPYDKTNYYARSSGILVEALCHGIPVLVPSGTWLSRQFAAEVYKYQESLKNTLEVVESRDNKGLDIIYDGNLTKLSTTNNNLRLDWKTPQAHFWLRVPKDSAFVLVKMQFAKENTSSALNLHVTQLNDEKISLFERTYSVEKTDLPYATVLIPLFPRVSKLWLGFKYPYTETVLTIEKIQVDVLKSTVPNDSIPWSSVGIVYDNPERISYNIKNMLENYDHYLNTARAFSDSYYGKHNAKELVMTLIEHSKEHNRIMVKKQ